MKKCPSIILLHPSYLPITLPLEVLVVLPSASRVSVLPRDVREAKLSCIFLYPFAIANCPIHTKVTRRVMNRQMEKPHQQKYLQPFIGYGRYFLHNHSVVKKKKKTLREEDTGRACLFHEPEIGSPVCRVLFTTKSHLKDQ